MSATLTAAGRPLWFIDNLARVHVDSASTGGAFDLVEAEGREGDMPPLHVHDHADETFYVLDGSLALHLPDRRILLEAGCAFVAPRAVAHTYRIESETARWLVLSTPGGFADFVREVSEEAETNELPSLGREHDVGALAAAAARHGIQLLGPPGALPTT